jgi:hypothetical protein
MEVHGCIGNYIHSFTMHTGYRAKKAYLLCRAKLSQENDLHV